MATLEQQQAALDRARVDTLTEQQLNAIGADATRLYHQTQAQLTEWKMWMSEQTNLIRLTDGSTPHGVIAQLKVWIGQVRLVYTRGGAKDPDSGAPAVEIAYDFPDELLLWLIPRMHETDGAASGYVFPNALKRTLVGAMIVPQHVTESHALAMTPIKL